MKKVFALAFAMTVFCGSWVNADQMLEVGPTTTLWATTPVAVGDGSENLAAATLYLLSNDGSETPQTYSGTISGTLHQIAEFGGNVATPTLDSNNPIDASIDSHWLYSPGSELSSAGDSVLVAGSAAEDFGNPSTENPASDTRFGTFLSQASPGVALSGLTAQRFDVAYLVFPADENLVSVGLVTWNVESGSNEGRVTAFSGESLLGEVPEPTTFVLLGLGLVGLVGYRRRK